VLRAGVTSIDVSWNGLGADEIREFATDVLPLHR
jgi:hypothetical protein